MARLSPSSPLPLIRWGLVTLLALVLAAGSLHTITHQATTRFAATTRIDAAGGMSPAGRSTPLVDLRQRSERIVRALDATARTIHLVTLEEGRYFEALDAEGHFLALVAWDPGSANLLEISRRRWQSPPEEFGALSVKQGAQQALFWLRRLGLLPSGARTSEPSLVSRLGMVLTYRVNGAGRGVTISLDRRSGEMMALRFDRERTSR